MNSDMKELPDGWRWVKLGDVCKIVIGRTPPRKEAKYWGGENLWVTIADIKGNEVRETKETISDSGAELCKNRMLKKGTLMFSFKLSIGKTAFADRDLYTNEAIAGILPITRETVDKHFLRYALSTVDYDAATGHAVKGKTLNKKSMSTLPIPLPPLDEQKRIANMISQRMAAQERVKAAATQQLEAVEAMRPALLRQAFGGTLCCRS